jgi:hypothetical protein
VNEKMTNKFPHTLEGQLARYAMAVSNFNNIPEDDAQGEISSALADLVEVRQNVVGLANTFEERFDAYRHAVWYQDADPEASFADALGNRILETKSNFDGWFEVYRFANENQTVLAESLEQSGSPLLNLSAQDSNWMKMYDEFRDEKSDIFTRLAFLLRDTGGNFSVPNLANIYIASASRIAANDTKEQRFIFGQAQRRLGNWLGYNMSFHDFKTIFNASSNVGEIGSELKKKALDAFKKDHLYSFGNQYREGHDSPISKPLDLLEQAYELFDIDALEVFSPAILEAYQGTFEGIRAVYDVHDGFRDQVISADPDLYSALISPVRDIAVEALELERNQNLGNYQAMMQFAAEKEDVVFQNQIYESAQTALSGGFNGLSRFNRFARGLGYVAEPLVKLEEITE